MKDKISLVEAAKEAGITRNKAKHWLELLGCCISKERQKTFVSPTAISMLSAMGTAINSGLTPSAAAERVKSSVTEVPATPVATTSQIQPIQIDVITTMMERLETLEKAVLRWVEGLEEKLNEEVK